MDCAFCSEAFDDAARRPKVLPCGHTACLCCLTKLQEHRCPSCRKGFRGPLEELPDNLLVIEHVKALKKRPGWWCNVCSNFATSECEETHSISRPRVALRQRLDALLQQLPQVTEGVRQALEGLTAADGDPGDVDETLHLLGGDVTLTPRGGAYTYSTSWQALSEQAGSLQYFLLQMLVCVLVKRGNRMDIGPKTVKTEKVDEPSPGNPVPPQQAQGQPAEVPARVPAKESYNADKFARSDVNKWEIIRGLEWQGIRRLVKWCDLDRDWFLKLLQSLAPTLEELSAKGVHGDHLRVIHGMPRLWRLRVRGAAETDKMGDNKPFAGLQLPPLGPHQAGLRWLRVSKLPPGVTAALLRAHAATLEVLILPVCSEDGGDGQPDDDDEAVLRQCGLPPGLRALRLLLLRGFSRGHAVQTCVAKQRALRSALPPATEVRCSACSELRREESF